MSGKDAMANGRDQAGALSRIGGDGLLEPLWAYDVAYAQERPAELAAGLVSLGFIRAALRRGARFWCAAAVAGLLAGVGLFIAAPPAYQASATVFITHGPNSYPPTAAQDDQALAQSREVAGLAMRNLGLRQSVSSFAAAYTVAPLSDRVFLITVTAPSTGAAVRRANAVAKAFLEFRNQLLETQQRLLVSSFNKQVDQTSQRVDSLSTQLSQLSAQPASTARREQLRGLRTEYNQASADLTQLEQAASSARAGAATHAAVTGSLVIDRATPIQHSRLKLLLFYAATGLLTGLALGLGIVVVLAVTSDRLRRRDDIAWALGAPVTLSVGPVHPSWWHPVRRGLKAVETAEVSAIAHHLGRVVQAGGQSTGDLAVIPVGNPRVAALSLVSLAVSCARDGKRVLLADLCRGAPAATLLGAAYPGVHQMSAQEAQLVVAVRDPDEAAPAGPRRGRTRRPRTAGHTPPAQPSAFTEAVTAASSSADVLLTLADLDPSLGGDHLATWASAAVAVVTAGKSSATRIHAVGEMIRLAGTRLVCAVLVGADKTDESLGVVPAPSDGGDATLLEGGRAL